MTVVHYSLIAFVERVTFWLLRIRSLPCAYVALFARRLAYNHYTIAHAYNAANAHAQGSDRAHWSQKVTLLSKAIGVYSQGEYYCGIILQHCGPRGHLYFRLDIILVKGLSKHTLNTYFPGMKIDPKYAFLHAFFLICPSCPLKICQYDKKKTHPFFQFCMFLHP